MNTSRIEVPLALPPPHFDDERTIATARQVRPIGLVKVTESWRKVRMLLPLLFLATLCGALGAVVVNYYERPQPQAAAAQESHVNNTIPAQPKTEPSPMSIAASAGVNESKPRSQSTAVEIEQTETKHLEPPPQPESKASPESNSAANATGNVQRKSTDSDAAKLTRKRRVQPVEDAPPRVQRNGAARISDIFGGPNP